MYIPYNSCRLWLVVTNFALLPLMSLFLCSTHISLSLLLVLIYPDYEGCRSGDLGICDLPVSISLPLTLEGLVGSIIFHTQYIKQSSQSLIQLEV